MVFYLSAALNRVENQLTELVREIAIKEANPKTSVEEEDLLNKEKEILDSTTSKEISPTETTSEIIEGIEELEDIVKNLLPSNIDESNEGIPNESKTPKSTTKK